MEKITDKRITAKKYNGNDSCSWAVFLDGKPKFTGLQKREIEYYKRIVKERITKK